MTGHIDETKSHAIFLEKRETEIDRNAPPFLLGKPVRVSSVTITFGSVAPGADVQLKMGDSDTRSAANEQSMTTVARKDGVSGTYTFTVTKNVTDQYLVIWFTKLPPVSGGAGKYMGQVFSVVINGAS